MHASVVGERLCIENARALATVTAADADDIDAMRAIWEHELSEMFSHTADNDVIEQALAVGSMSILRQMCS